MKDEAVGEGREGDIRRRQYVGAPDDPHPLVGHRTRGRLEEEESRAKAERKDREEKEGSPEGPWVGLSQGERHDSTGLPPDVWSGFDPSFIMGV